MTKKKGKPTRKAKGKVKGKRDIREHQKMAKATKPQPFFDYRDEPLDGYRLTLSRDRDTLDSVVTIVKLDGTRVVIKRGTYFAPIEKLFDSLSPRP